MADLAVNPAEETAETAVTEHQTDPQADTAEKTEEQKATAREAYAERKAREEAANLRKELDAYKRRDEEAKSKAEEDRKAKLTEEARIREERDQFAAEVENYRMNDLRARICREFNLRDEMVSRLIGTDEASIRADAEDLVAKGGYTKARAKVGTATNPTSDQGPKGAPFTAAQLADATFFRANEKEIMQAYKEGRITR